MKIALSGQLAKTRETHCLAEDVTYVTEDDVLQLAFFLCNLLYEHDFISTSNRFEQLIDQLLNDFGRN